MKQNKTLTFLAQTIFDKKGFNILVLDVQSVNTMTDYLVIAEGNVDRHVKAIAQAVIDGMEQLGHPLCNSEGSQAADWIVLDFGDVMVHLFIPELRERYALEELWNDGKIVDVEIKHA
jgi:ribosome-associated protein